MVKRLLSKIFGALRSDADSPAAIAAKGGADPRNFVEFVVKSLVDAPETVKVDSNDEEGGMVIEIRCRQEEIGRVIGKRGKTISAIRALVKTCPACADKKVSVVVHEQ